MSTVDRRRHAHWRFIWPNSLAGRFAVIIAGGLLTLVVIALTIDWHGRKHDRLAFYASAIGERIVNVVREFDAAEPAQRRNLIRLVSSRHFRVQLSTGEPQLKPLPWFLPGVLEEEVGRQMAQLGDRPWHVGFTGSRYGPGDSLLPGFGPGGPEARRHSDMELGNHPGAEPGPRPNGERWREFDPTDDHGPPAIVATVQLTDGNWVLFRISSPLPRPPRGIGFALWLGLTVIIILLISVWAAHRMTKPLRQFASAADALGLDVRAPPLPEHGSREMRRATRAFNEMQSRIRRLVDDRTMMLAAISHDLKTALTRLRLRAEFIDDEEQQAKALADLEEMQAMLEATLSFARDDAAEEAPTALDLASMLQSLCADHADAGHEVTYRGPDRLRFKGRPVALRRVFANLIDNAVRYGNGAEVDAIDEGSIVKVRIADSGPGIPEDRRDDVFRPFYRLETSRNRETGGTGLGLAVARSIVHRHGGEIALDGHQGGGLLVEVILPRLSDVQSS